MVWEALADSEGEKVAATETLSLIPDGVIGTDAFGRIVFFSPAAERLFGYSSEELIGNDVGRLLPHTFRASHERCVSEFGIAKSDEQRLMATRVEVRGLHRNGSEFPAEVSLSRRKLGQRTILIAVVRDITERRQLELELRERSARLEENERRLRLALDSGHLGTWVWEAETSLFRIDQTAQHILGLAGAESTDLRTLIASTIPEDRPTLEEAFASALDGLTVDCEFGRHLPDGSRRIIALTGSRSEKGMAGNTYFGVLRDVTQRRQIEQQRELIVGELNHRIGNLMSVVNSVVRLTAKHCKTAHELQGALQDRLKALGERHQLLNRQGWTSVGLDSLLNAELRPYAAPGGRNLKLSGGPIRIAEDAANSLGMILHELATNSAKHGALSSTSGCLSVTWQADEENDALTVVWLESGGPEVSQPRRSGFGTTLVERLVKVQFGGEFEQIFRSAGFEAHFRLPLSKLCIPA